MQHCRKCTLSWNCGKYSSLICEQIGFLNRVLAEFLLNFIQSPASSQFVHAVSVCFACVRNYITFIITTHDYTLCSEKEEVNKKTLKWKKKTHQNTSAEGCFDLHPHDFRSTTVVAAVRGDTNIIFASWGERWLMATASTRPALEYEAARAPWCWMGQLEGDRLRTE